MNKLVEKIVLNSCLALLFLTAKPFHAAAEPARVQRILFVGDSITDGHGLTRDQAFPALIQAKIAEKKWPFEVVNAGVSGETSAGGRRRMAWLLKQPVDILILELGGNDGLRGIDPADTRTNLAAIIDGVKEKNPDATIILAGMQLPPNLSEAYLARFVPIYPELAREKNALLIEEFLAGVGGKPEMNLEDQIHPNPEGHKVLSETLWKKLEPELQKRLEKQ